MNFVHYDKETQEVLISLPPSAMSHALALKDDLAAEFAFEPPGAKTLDAMNAYARDWLEARGVASGGV